MKLNQWHHEAFLWVAIAVVVVLALAYALDFTRRRRVLEKIGNLPQLSRMASSVSQDKRVLKAVLMVLGVALITLSLARPQPSGVPMWKPRGIDMIVALDLSKSMLAEDVYPSRVERAKIDADALIDKFKGERVGVVAFGGEAIHYPLTTDHEAVKILYHGLNPGDLPPGTDIGEAVLASRCLLLPGLEGDTDCMRAAGGGRGGDPLVGGGQRRKLEASDIGDRGRAIVLFTDGEDTEGHAKAEVEHAAKLGIDVYIVGVGTAAGRPIPVKTPDGNSYVTARLDEPALKELAKAGGGEDHYFHADPKRFTVDGVVKALARLKEGNLVERTETIPDEAYPWFLFPGFLALLVEACLSDRRRATKKRVQA